MHPAIFSSDYAILDVKRCRGFLAKRIKGGEKVRVRLEMLIDCVHGNDDGVSIEFSGSILSVKEYAR